MKTSTWIAGLAASAASLPALAHVGSDGGGHHNFLDTLTHALAHPFTGADHLAAMIAVGAWSALAWKPAQGAARPNAARPGAARPGAARNTSVWQIPTAFVALLVAGCLAGFAGLQVPAVEPMIAASVLVLGLLVMVQKKMARGAAAGLVGVFAFFHGAAHGYELFAEAGSTAVAALLGMSLGSAALHMAGMLLGHGLLQRHRWLAAASGAATAALGLLMLTRLA